MDTDRIKQIRKRKQEAAERKYENFQAGGDNKYYYEYQHYSDLVSICDIALSVSEIRDKYFKTSMDMQTICSRANKYKKNGDYYDADTMKYLLEDIVLFGRKYGFIPREE